MITRILRRWRFGAYLRAVALDFRDVGVDIVNLVYVDVLGRGKDPRIKKA